MEKTHKIILSALAVLLVGIITACVIVTSSKIGKEQSVADFSAPSFDTTAVLGEPDDIPTDAQYKTLTIKEGFKISMASVVSANDGYANVYFTSDSQNTAWLKLVILNDKGKTIGESGLLKQGEHLKQIKLNNLSFGDEVTIKILSYEPDTYYSLGTAQVKVPINKK